MAIPAPILLDSSYLVLLGDLVLDLSILFGGEQMGLGLANRPGGLDS